MKPCGTALRASSRTDPSRPTEAREWRSHNTSLVALALIAAVTFIIVMIPCCAMASPEPSPEVAELLTPEETARISSMVISEVEQRGFQTRLEDDFLFITFSDQEEHSFIIRDLRIMCAYVDEGSWGEIIELYMDHLFMAVEETKSLMAEIHGVEDAAPYLGLCLFPWEYIQHAPNEDPVYRYDIEGMITCLMWDLPWSRTTIEWSEIEGWDCSVDELFSIALENTLEKYPAVLVEVNLLPELDLLVCEDEGNLVSTHILALDRLPGAVGTHGSLVSVPSHDTLLVYPIEDERVIMAYIVMALIANDSAKISFSPLIELVYWYDGQALINIPYVMGEEFPEFDIYNMPAEFLRLLLTMVN
jgi:hypothetical protein